MSVGRHHLYNSPGIIMPELQKIDPGLPVIAIIIPVYKRTPSSREPVTGLSNALYYLKILPNRASD